MQTSNNVSLCLVLVDVSAVLQRDVQLSIFPKLIELELCHNCSFNIVIHTSTYVISNCILHTEGKPCTSVPCQQSTWDFKFWPHFHQ